jgi:maltooligosyltrehalose trehalohydrolase
MTRAWQFGPSLLDDGRVRFRLWAPNATTQEMPVRLELVGLGPLPMAAQAGGWYEVIAPACPESRYRFRFDDGTVIPDPASRGQAGDVHDASIVMRPDTYQWQHTAWRGRPWHEAVIYEMHVGVLGGFAAAMEHLPRLAELGITAIELMPVAEFPGTRNWGYDGVLPFAPECSYGTPESLRAFVDAAHGLGLMVILDVVYNHFGPEGNVWPQVATHMFREDLQTPWGPAIDFRQREVRRFLTENVLYWLEDFRLDGLRLDAVHAIEDAGWLRETLTTVREGIDQTRHVHLILENDDNDATLLRDGFTAQWNDDFHHALHVLLTGETHGYYGDYSSAATPPIAHLARVLAEGFAYQGHQSSHRGAARGKPSSDLPPTAFISFLQNHDQIGNRAQGERLTQLTDPQALRCAVALHCLSPQIPLLFMGEECGSQTPFPYFTDLPPELAEAVRAGRQLEFADMAGSCDTTGKSVADPELPDPNAPATFTAACPSFCPNTWTEWYRELLAIRRQHINPLLHEIEGGTATVLSDRALQATWSLAGGGALHLWLNLASQSVAIAPWQHGPPLFATVPNAAATLCSGRLSGYSIVIDVTPGTATPTGDAR